MQTDIPLKVLVKERGADLFSILDIPSTFTLLSVESLELQAVARRLDVLLHLVTPDGQHHKHIVEWHGWYDRAVLWRTIGYVGLYGQDHPDDPLTITLVYLNPTCDMGDTITQIIGSTVMFECKIHCVRLWKIPVAKALVTGLPGLAALSPLMDGASEETLQQAVTIIRNTTNKPQQDNLLTILGGFAVPLVSSPLHLLQIVGREPFVESDLFKILFEEEYGKKVLAAKQQIEAAEEQMDEYRKQLALQQQELHRRDEELHRRDEELHRRDEELHRRDEELHRRDEELHRKDQELHDAITSLRHGVLQTLTIRFPQVPAPLLVRLHQFNSLTHLKTLLHAISIAQSVSDVEQAVQQLEESSQN